MRRLYGCEFERQVASIVEEPGKRYWWSMRSAWGPDYCARHRPVERLRRPPQFNVLAIA
jgi:hypothetical protein